MTPDTLTAIAAAISGSACAILALRPPTGRHLTNVRAAHADIVALHTAAERRRRNRRIIWLAVIIVGVSLLIALAATDVGAAPAAACRTIVNAPTTVTNINRRPAGGFEVAIRLTGSRTVASIITTRRLYLRQPVKVSGTLCAENQLTGATIR